MKKLVHMVMLSCKKATELIEKKFLTKLSFKENLQLHLHKSICDACTAYEKQSKRIDEILQSNIHSKHPEDIETIKNTALKEKILKSLS